MTEILPDTVTRKSVPLTQRDLDDLAKLRGDGQRRDALAHLVRTPVPDSASDAALLHTIILAGMRAVQDEIDEAGYAEWAASMTDEEKAERRAFARRRRPDWADNDVVGESW